MNGEKRKTKRLALNVNIVLERLDEVDNTTTMRFLPVHVVDMSKEGIGFITTAELEMNSFYDTQIEIWTKEVIRAVIKIVRIQKLSDGNGFNYGCTLLGLSDIDRFKIDVYQLLAEVQGVEQEEGLLGNGNSEPIK